MNHLTNKVYFILSACKGNNPKADAVYTEELADILNERGDNYRRVSGRYKGTIEESFLVESPSAEGSQYTSRELAKATLLELASVFEQESIAEIDANNSLLYLHYTKDGRQECLGKVRVTSDEPSGDHTKVGDKYFTLYDS